MYLYRPLCGALTWSGAALAAMYDPMAREQPKEMHNTLGLRYINAVWALRAFEQQTPNEEAMVRWRASYPVWNRLFGRPATDLHARVAQFIAMPAARLDDSKGA